MFKYKDGEIVKSTKTQDCECPNCKSDDIEYDITEVYSDQSGAAASQRCTCKCCGFEFTNWYLLAYDGFSTDNGDFDKDGELA